MEQRKELGGIDLDAMFEPPDTDDQAPHEFTRGYLGASLPVKFLDGKFVPYAEGGFNSWGRHGTNKKAYGDLSFFDFRSGIDFNYKDIDFKAGLINPFGFKVDQGKKPRGDIGFELGVMFPLSKSIRAGLLFESYRFDKNAPDVDRYLVSFEFKLGNKPK